MSIHYVNTPRGHGDPEAVAELAANVSAAMMLSITLVAAVVSLMFVVKYTRLLSDRHSEDVDFTWKHTVVLMVALVVFLFSAWSLISRIFA